MCFMQKRKTVLLSLPHSSLETGVQQKTTHETHDDKLFSDIYGCMIAPMQSYL